MVKNNSVQQVLAAAQKRLEAAGSDEPEANAQWLLAYALGVSRTWVLANGGEDVPAEKYEVFLRMLARKEGGAPLSHIVGTQPFCGLDIRVTPDVLTPRPETEELVALAASAFDRRGKYEFLDMCTGSGCIAVALAHQFPNAVVLAADKSEAALKVAQENVRAYRLENRIQLLQSDIWENVMGTFDLIISNPPYIHARSTARTPLGAGRRERRIRRYPPAVCGGRRLFKAGRTAGAGIMQRAALAAGPGPGGNWVEG